MNFLAHAYLSFNDPGILVGNMASDFIKGKKQYDFPPPIQLGIRLHRAIDAFTDDHGATKELRSFFRPAYRLYSGAFADVAYDHFLANDARIFRSPEQLRKFTTGCYAVLQKEEALLPPIFRQMMPHMVMHDWLYHYRFKEGIQKSFGGLVRRATFLAESDTAFAIFTEHYDAIQDCYNVFFPELEIFAARHLQELLKG
jgi:acyl carrier protein phosphodiesterase